ncbi:MAG: hypothetical protein LBF91_06140 [Azoarcus sp.]|jgi:hypothetical protein|nr:hypothetical protein [Azoarcus sp.]
MSFISFISSVLSIPLVPGSVFPLQFGVAGTNYVGPDYSAGQLGGKINAVDPLPSPTNAVDEAAMRHDIANHYADSSATPNMDTLRADAQFLTDLTGLLQADEMPPEETTLAEVALDVFIVKTVIGLSAAIHEAYEIISTQWDASIV